MKDWAPGMVIPRKKAASADDIIRGSERDDLVSAEDVWSKRSKDLANAKQSKLVGRFKHYSVCIYSHSLITVDDNETL